MWVNPNIHEAKQFKKLEFDVRFNQDNNVNIIEND